MIFNTRHIVMFIVMRTECDGGEEDLEPFVDRNMYVLFCTHKSVSIASLGEAVRHVRKQEFCR